MSEPESKIVLPAKSKSKFVWVPPLCSTIDGCDCWDESDLRVPCSVNGCIETAKAKYCWYKEGVKPRWKQYGDDCHYDSSCYYAVLDCGCQAPVCDECAIDCSGHCRLCGQVVDTEIVSKGSIMKGDNWRDESNRGFWMMIHTDANDFIDTNLGKNWSFFLSWFLANGGEIDITEINTDDMCDKVSDFKLFCLKWVFLRSTSAFTKRIPLAPVASIFNPRFDIFMRESAGFLGSLRIIIFRKKDLERYRFFGFMMKMIAKITRDSVVYIGGRENQIFAACFRRFYARLLTKF
jgi:hypothetical protein